MKIKLKPVKPKFKNKYVIVASFMHGDADAYTDETYVCKNEGDFIRIASASEGPQEPGSGGDEDAYNTFYASLFGQDFVPCDCTCQDYPAAFQSMEGFYYDNEGVKFEATL